MVFVGTSDTYRKYVHLGFIGKRQNMTRKIKDVQESSYIYFLAC